MEKLKDILYNKNDVLVAIVIIAVAALVISIKIDTLMHYSSVVPGTEVLAGTTLGENQSEKNEDGEETGNNNYSPSSEDANNQNQAKPDLAAQGTITEPANQGADQSQGTLTTQGQPNSNSTQAQGTPQYPHSIYIAYGATLASVGKTLTDLGYFTSSKEFTDAVEAAGLGSKIQSGNFQIPANASHEQVLKILTKQSI